MAEKFVVTFRIEKTGMMRYISHLDMVRLMHRAGRRASLPVALSQGYNPHMKIKIEPALKLGLESRDLKGTFELTRPMKSDEFESRLQSKLPDGIRVSGAAL